MKPNNATEKNNFGGGCKMKLLNRIKTNIFGGASKMRIEKMIVFLALFAILAVGVFAATVSHTAEQIRAGIFGNVYTGNWSVMNRNVGIGTISEVNRK